MAAWDINSRTIIPIQMRSPLIFKFGGASVKDTNSVKNVAKIIGQHDDRRPIIVVVSAMGKTTNAFEEVVRAFAGDEAGKEEQMNKWLDDIQEFHLGIIRLLERSVDEVHNVGMFVSWVVVKPWCIVFEGVRRRRIIIIYCCGKWLCGEGSGGDGNCSD